jgi:acetyl-CoA C-acetyltransferase
VAGPLKRSDCSLVSDGAAALVIAAETVAGALVPAVRWKSRTQVNEYLPLSRRDPTRFEGAALAWQRGLDAAGARLADLGFVETHDCFTIAELLEYEAMGLAPQGQGARVILDGITTMDGRLPVNPSGGLKSRGHPIGATGVSQHVMAAMQLAGQAGDMQVKDPRVGAVFNMGGAAVANYLSVLEAA